MVERMRAGRPGASREPLGRSFLELLDAGLIAAAAVTVLAVGASVFLAFDQARWSLGFWGTLATLLLVAGGVWAALVEAPLGLLRERAGWPLWIVRVLKFVMLVPAAAIGLLFAGQFSGELLTAWSVVLVLPVFAIIAITEFFHRPRGRWWIGLCIWGGMLLVAVVLMLVGGVTLPGAPS